MHDPQRAIEVLQRLQNSGVLVALDDFGTGHSSLGLVSELPIDVLKLDRSLIQRTDTDAKARTIFTRLVEMAHDVGLEVVAEGVETRAQIELCQAVACELIQGFAFYKPMGLAALQTLLAKSGDMQ